MMPSFVDSPYISLVQNTQRPNYFAPYAQMFGLMEQTPWSYRNQRAEAVQNYQMMMQQQRMAADLAQRQQEMAIKQQLLPYQIARYKQLAGYGQPTSSPLQKYIDAINAYHGNQAQPRAPQPYMGPTTQMLPTDDLPTDSSSPTPSDVSLIPVNPNAVSPDAPSF